MTGSATDTQAEIERLEERCRELERLVRHAELERRQVVSRLLRAEQQERRRIATELHDDTVQVLTASLLALDRLAQAAPADPDRVRSVAEATRRTLAAATERTRRLMFELRPANGLAAAVRELAEQARAEADLEVSVAVPEIDVPFVVEEVAYRTVREAVSNVRRHARARTLAIVMNLGDGRLHGSVRDDGRGFDPARIRANRELRLHLGLETLIERIKLAGGCASVRSAPGHGTEIEFDLPVDDVVAGARAR
jgi:signal transduction histidine kinase